MLQRFCTAGFQVAGLPHGILLASLITLHKRGEIASNVGNSVQMGTEAREAGAGAKKGSKGSRGVGNEEEETKEANDEEHEVQEEEQEEEEEEEQGKRQEEEETEEEEHEEGREKDKKEESGPCMVVELSAPGGRTEDVEKGTGDAITVLLILLLLSEGAETGGIWDIPGGGRKETDDGN
jgi:hypothetical protein